MQLTQPQHDILERARACAAEVLSPVVVANDRAAKFPLDELKALADAGLMGVNVSQDHGGLGAGVVAYSLAVTEVAAVDPAVAVTMCVNNMVAEVIERFGNDRHHDEFLRPLVAGEFNSGSFCLSEAGAGSDPQGMLTRATEAADGWRVTGSKAWITSGAFARPFVVWAKTDDRITTFLIDSQTPGVTPGKPEEKMGQHASNTCSIAFDDVAAPADSILGELGGGFRIAMVALDGGRIGIASQSLGIARAALQYVDDEDLAAEFEAARLLTLRAAWLKETRGTNFSREASMAKMYASEVAGRACDAALRAVGPAAYEHDHPVAKLHRDARVTRIYEGTNEIQRVVIGRDLLRHGVGSRG